MQAKAADRPSHFHMQSRVAEEVCHFHRGQACCTALGLRSQHQACSSANQNLKSSCLALMMIHKTPLSTEEILVRYKGSNELSIAGEVKLHYAVTMQNSQHLCVDSGQCWGAGQLQSALQHTHHNCSVCQQAYHGHFEIATL